ncbi:hypothetical protein J3R30DRAFT_1797075 [Lentinula aciculospora]|uniref:Uncharacterized protein n=1 Tax=Lentinula aciculospora TaxID=153920 RepID=A0A9W9DRX2_9AGAR|nr:hypothetical protein J3R30DRAFT_1797075 [Lentinula aciculospora]
MQSRIYQVDHMFFVIPFHFFYNHCPMFRAMRDSPPLTSSSLHVVDREGVRSESKQDHLSMASSSRTIGEADDWIEIRYIRDHKRSVNIAEEDPNFWSLANVYKPPTQSTNALQCSPSISTLHLDYPNSEVEFDEPIQIPTIVLPEDMSTLHFEMLLKVIKPRIAPEPAENPSLTIEEWFMVLHLATAWRISCIRELAFSMIKDNYRKHTEELRMNLQVNPNGAVECNGTQNNHDQTTGPVRPLIVPVRQLIFSKMIYEKTVQCAKHIRQLIPRYTNNMKRKSLCS